MTRNANCIKDFSDIPKALQWAINFFDRSKLFAKRLHLKNYTLNTFSDHSEEEGILHFASGIRADRIAMATHGRTGFAHLLSGSIAEAVANHAAKPVLTFVISTAYQ
jgi:hypothetical protein